jgi:hypothetical protein
MRIFGPSLANEQAGELREALVSTDFLGAKTIWTGSVENGIVGRARGLTTRCKGLASG